MKTTICTLVLLLLTANSQEQTPKLNSYPAAPATIFLNFDGAGITGTAWNWNGPINAQPAGLAGEAVMEIFNRVAEDFRPFNINVTTDAAVYAAATFNKRIQIILTPTSDWYGRAGGVSFVGSFTWGDGTPAWVFSALLYNNPKNVAEACSHEAGHTLGLQHQSSYDQNCQKTEEYNSGQGSGEIGWAPIMGVGYAKNFTTWHTGSSTEGCNVIQNDLDLIGGPQNGFGYRSDDYGNNTATATLLSAPVENFQANGLINQQGDVDVFRLQIRHATRLRLNAIPLNVGTGNQGANIDIRVSMLNAGADTLGNYNPTSLLDAGIDTELTAGEYFVAVRGTGNVNHSDYGSIGAYLLTGTLMSALPVQQFVLKGTMANGDCNLYWSYISDEAIKSLVVESSEEGNQFTPLYTSSAGQRSYTWQSGYAPAYYRLKAVTAGGAVYYSNIVHLFANITLQVRLLSSVVRDNILFTAAGPYAYHLFDAAGKLVASGHAVPGTNTLSARQAPVGLLILQVSDGAPCMGEKIN